MRIDDEKAKDLIIALSGISDFKLRNSCFEILCSLFLKIIKSLFELYVRNLLLYF